MTKIDVVSGFLGAGKTTLIKKLIEEDYKGEKIVLVENEFGEVGIDSGFLKNAGIEISELNSGCICCTLAGDFEKSLKEVLKRFTPERILIEPSGVGKLSDVIAAIRNVEKEHDILLCGLVTVVNTRKALKQMRSFGEFFNNQLIYAKTIVLSHTQTVEEAVLEKVVARLKEKNDRAIVVTSPWDQLTCGQLKEAVEAKHAMEAALMEVYHQHEHNHENENQHEHHLGHEHQHEHGSKVCHGEECDCHDHHADEVFTSFGLETPRKFKQDEIKKAMAAFCNQEEYGVILRAKGMVDSSEGEWIYFDFVDGESEIRSGAPDYTGRICVIGTRIDQEKLVTLFSGPSV